jgi:rfaE bifunctional protein kinase chain/domain
MNTSRFEEIAARYSKLRIGVLGDFCLDRYLEIDPALAETSIETGLPVHNVVRVRAQPGAAGTILNNLVALGIGRIVPIGFCGFDGEGYELVRALESLSGVDMGYFCQTSERRTATYCKPLLMHPGKAPEELNRLDNKNWSRTPSSVESTLISSLELLAGGLDALILLDQMDVAWTGVITPRVLECVGTLAERKVPGCMLADSRRGLKSFPPLAFKMNGAELASLTGQPLSQSLPEVRLQAQQLAKFNHWPAFVTLAERGIVGATPDGETFHHPSLPLRGEIDIVGAGDSVTANLAAALAAGGTVAEAIELANTAASVVIHQLGTTGTASQAQIRQLIAS